MKPDQLGQMSEKMLQIVRSALEEEQAPDAVDTLTSAFIQGQLPSREIFFSILAIVYGAPDFVDDEEALSSLDRKIGRFEWTDLGPSTIISAMLLLKRWLTTNPRLVASYLFDAQKRDEYSDGWLARYSIDGGSGSDSDDPGGAPLVPLLRLASQMQMCDDVWQLLSLRVPKWTANGGLSSTPTKQGRYAKLHEGDIDEDHKSVEERDNLRRMGVWRVLSLLTSLWTQEADSGTTDSLTSQLQQIGTGRRRRQGNSLAGYENAMDLLDIGLTDTSLWHSHGDDVVEPSEVTITLFELLQRRCDSLKKRDLLVSRMCECFARMDAAVLADLGDVSERAARLLLQAALRHLDVSAKDRHMIIDESEVRSQVDGLLSSKDLDEISRKALELTRTCRWLSMPMDWTAIEKGVLANQFVETRSHDLRKATEAILNNPAWTLERGSPILTSRSRSSYTRASPGLEVLVEATMARLETFTQITRRIELQTFVCDSLPGLCRTAPEEDLRNRFSSLVKDFTKAVCQQGARETKELRLILERMRFSYTRLVHEALSVKRPTTRPPSLYKKPKLASSSSSFDEAAEDSVEEVQVPEMFTVHLAHCKGLLSELSLLLDRTEANIETLEAESSL
jgi:hypothetical protein